MFALPRQYQVLDAFTMSSKRKRKTEHGLFWNDVNWKWEYISGTYYLNISSLFLYLKVSRENCKLTNFQLNKYYV